jgi:serine/threonine-protein kinase RsbW
LRKNLVDWGLARVENTAALVLSELLTNAVRHACASPGREIETRFVVLGDRLRIEVHDAADERPIARASGISKGGGRGIFLVAALADAWDVAPRDGVGKVVWAEVNSPDLEGGSHAA